MYHHHPHSKRIYFLDDLERAEGRVPRDLPLIPPLSALPDAERAAWEKAQEEVGDTTLPVTRTPVIDAFVYCALKGWGAELLVCDAQREVRFLVTDLKHLLLCLSLVCTKHMPTYDLGARFKTLERWLPGITMKLAEAQGKPCELSVACPPSRYHRDMPQFAKLCALIDRVCETTS